MINITGKDSAISAGKSLKYYFVVPLLSILLLLFAKFTTGIRNDHYFLIIIVNAAFYFSHYSRRMITGLAIIIFYWIIFDSMKAWPNWSYNSVDIVPLYNLEKSLFGFRSGGIIVTPNEYFNSNHSSFLDVLCGFFYLSWVPLPLIFAMIMYFKNKNLFLRFCMAFFTVNMVGFVIYYLHPAAPPWYHEIYGDTLNVQTKSYAAGLLRFDSFFGINLFSGLYSKGSNVFAAMPSLHASYPLIGLYYSFLQPMKWLRYLFGIVMIGIWFSAVYLSHHYILDVIAGILCGTFGIFFFEKVLMKNKWFSSFMNNYEEHISRKTEPAVS